jgi:hypothetical protein
MGHPFTFFIRVTVAVHPFLSLIFPSGRLKGWQMEHLASNSAFADPGAGSTAKASPPARKTEAKSIAPNRFPLISSLFVPVGRYFPYAEVR